MSPPPPRWAARCPTTRCCRRCSTSPPACCGSRRQCGSSAGRSGTTAPPDRASPDRASPDRLRLLHHGGQLVGGEPFVVAVAGVVEVDRRSVGGGKSVSVRVD